LLITMDNRETVDIKLLNLEISRIVSKQSILQKRIDVAGLKGIEI